MQSGALFGQSLLTDKNEINAKFYRFVIFSPNFFSQGANTSMVHDIDRLGLKLKIHESYEALQKL